VIRHDLPWGGIDADGRRSHAIILRGDLSGLEMLSGRHPSLDVFGTGGRGTRPGRLAALI
jgi:hypothetical protein